MKKNNIILLSAIILLSFTYILSLIKEGDGIEKREEIKSALINPSNAGQIVKLELYDAASYLKLEKIDNIWQISQEENTFISIPADASKIESFVSDFSKVRSMYKISDKLSKNNSFGLTDASAFKIRYYYASSFDDLIFGNQDFSLSSRYLMSGRKTDVYEINDEIQKYLTSSVQFWSEPYLISRYTSGIKTFEDIQSAFRIKDGKKQSLNVDSRFMELRHGGLPLQSELERLEELEEIRLEIGNKLSIILYFYKKENAELSDGIYVKEIYESSSGKKEYWVKISSWTYNRISEITL